jgi:hypothetical protein
MRLLSLNLEEVTKLLNDMEKEVKAIKKELFKISWFMRGGLTIDLAYQTDYQDREIIGKIIEENLEITGKSKLPFF